MFGFQAGNLRRFSIEDITFDYNLKRNNMDGIHIHGNCHEGRIVNVKGTTNDDLVALNADDGSMVELSRGPITDILVDGIWSQNGYTAVRLLSAGSPIQRIKLANIFGTYRNNIVSFSNHNVHPGEPSTFDDISIQGVFCSKSSVFYGSAQLPDGPADAGLCFGALSLIFIQAPAVVSNLSIRDYYRTETVMPADDIHIQPGAHVDNLLLDGMTVTNRSGNPSIMLHNCGTIENLALQNVRAAAGGSVTDIIKNEGTIGHIEKLIEI